MPWVKIQPKESIWIVLITWIFFTFYLFSNVFFLLQVLFKWGRSFKETLKLSPAWTANSFVSIFPAVNTRFSYILGSFRKWRNCKLSTIYYKKMRLYDATYKFKAVSKGEIVNILKFYTLYLVILCFSRQKVVKLNT